jgi:hypothetical protein
MTIASHSVFVKNISIALDNRTAREKFSYLIDYIIKFIIPQVIKREEVDSSESEDENNFEHLNLKFPVVQIMSDLESIHTLKD